MTDARTPQGKHEFLQAFLDGSPIATFVIDRQRRVSLWNRALEQLTGVPKEKVLGKAFDSGIFYRQKPRPVLAELVLDGKVEAIGELYRGKRLGSSPVISSAFEATDEFFLNGRYRTVYFTAAVVHDAAGEVLGAIETLQDVTARARAEKKVRQHERRLRVLAGQLSAAEQRERRQIATDLHDTVGQSLAAIKMKLQLLRGRPAGASGGAGGGDGGGGVLEDVFRLIDEAGRRTRTLTFGLCPPALYDLGLPAALEGLAERISQEHGIDCRVESEGSWVHLDDDLCGLLFRSARELVLNAVKHARCRSIVIAVARPRGRVRITVADDGIGFDPSRVDRYSEKDGGFGLFSVRERLACLGGRLAIDSHLKGGARVTIEAPVTPGNAPAARGTRLRKGSPGQEPRR
jgi:PAS domain S-box-containing protein